MVEPSKINEINETIEPFMPPPEENIDDDFIDTACSLMPIINYVREYFRKNRFTEGRARKLIRLILNNNGGTYRPINMDLLGVKPSFKRYNLGKLENGMLKTEKRDELKKNILEMMKNIEVRRELEQLNDDENDDENEDAGLMYLVNKSTTYRKIISHLINNGQEATFKYNFENPDLPLLNVPDNTPILQRCLIQITSPGIKFGFPIRYQFVCRECNKDFDSPQYITEENALNIVSTSTIVCGRSRTIEKPDGSVKTITCTERLKPSKFEGGTVDAFYYNIVYKDEVKDETYTSTMISFNNYPPGQYDAVLYKTFQPNAREQYHVVDVKESETKKPFAMPEKVQGENYVITLQKGIDKYIEEQAGIEIWGVLPVKAALILQAAFSYFSWDLIGNIFLIGQRSTGKTLLFRYWCPMLYGWYSYATTGVSISIPGLRGTEIKLNLLGKDVTDLSIGYLGIFRSIVIDEAGQNPDLIKDMKSFIYEMEYSMDKKGGKGVRYIRKAHLNLTGNLSIIWKTHYINEIKKLYKELPEEPNPEDTTTILPKPDWNERWDLYMPLSELGKVAQIHLSDDKTFPNFYLLKAVEKKRIESYEKDTWWIDGMDMAVHDRFPFYFYLVNSRKLAVLQKVVSKNTSRKVLKKNIDIVNALDSKTLQEYIKGCKEFEVSPNDEEAFDEVNRILEEYNEELSTYNARLEGFFQMLVKASRMLNRRMEYTTEDFDLLKWLLNTTNRKIEIEDLSSYSFERGKQVLPSPAPYEGSTTGGGKPALTPDEAFGEYRGLIEDIPKGAWHK